MDPDTIDVRIEMSRTDHRAAKLLAVKRGMYLRRLVVELLQREVKEDQEREDTERARGTREGGVQEREAQEGASRLHTDA